MSDHLTQSQRAELKRRLAEELARLTARVDDAARVASAGSECGDMQDKAADENQRRQASARADRDRRRQAEVESALERMADGTFGVCEETGEPIPAARLMVEPTTRLTIEAQQMLESEQGQAGRAPGSSANEDPY